MTGRIVAIPEGLLDNMIPSGALSPNDWNPNRMDAFMRGKLRAAVEKDGFVVPVLVRPMPRDGKGEKAGYARVENAWQIVDGEHRWRIGVEELGMAELPVVDLGAISRAHAMEITVKANALRGEFDSLELARLMRSMADEVGRADLEAAMPFQPERIDAMLALVDESRALEELAAAGLTMGGEEREGGAAEFKSFDPTTQKFAHFCPRCNFRFNPTDASKPRDEDDE